MIAFGVLLAVATVVAYRLGKMVRLARERPEVFGAPEKGRFWRVMVYLVAIAVVVAFFWALRWFLALVYFAAWMDLQ